MPEVKIHSFDTPMEAKRFVEWVRKTEQECNLDCDTYVTVHYHDEEEILKDMPDFFKEGRKLKKEWRVTVTRYK